MKIETTSGTIHHWIDTTPEALADIVKSAEELDLVISIENGKYTVTGPQDVLYAFYDNYLGIVEEAIEEGAFTVVAE